MNEQQLRDELKKQYEQRDALKKMLEQNNETIELLEQAYKEKIAARKPGFWLAD